MVSYTIVISALSKRGRLAAASKLLDRMDASGVQPDVMCFNTLISGAASAQKWDLVERLLTKLREAGGQPDQWTYGPLLEACRRSGDRKRARRIGKEMLTECGPPSTFCMTSLRRLLGTGQLKALCREAGVEWPAIGDPDYSQTQAPKRSEGPSRRS